MARSFSTEPSGLRFSSPLEYERMLRAAHEKTLAGTPQPDISADVQRSWRRSLAAGINPDAHLPRHLHEVSEVVSLRRAHVLQAVMPALSELLADESVDGQHLLVMADATGEILWRVGSPNVLRRADTLEFVEGADWSETGIGTNAISEAVINGRTAQLFSAEHLVRTHHEWVCTASPIRDPATGVAVGVLTVSGPLNTVSVDSVRMVQVGVRLAEELLRTRSPEPRPLPARTPGLVALELLGGSPAVVRSDGVRLPLSLRRAEILALLDSRTRGWTADELAYEVHGETGTASTIRIEMHRIRLILGSLLESGPYRLAPAAQGMSDVRRVLRLVREGQVSAALAGYTGPLLERSTARAIEPLRAELTAAVGSLVRVSGDADLIRRWCATEMGCGDAAAVHELGRLTGLADPGYLALRARLERIDHETGARCAPRA
ncbi:MAG: transcriptional regulator [Cryobacterium sp.]